MSWDMTLIFFVLAVLIPWRGRVKMKKLLAQPQVGTMERLTLYASTIAFQWLLAALAAGGQLVYATCSLEPEENAGVVEKVLSQEPAFRLATTSELVRQHPHLISLFDSRGYFRTRPDEHAMDGFTAAVIARQGSM